MIRLYLPALLLIFWAALLAVIGDGTTFAVIALCSTAGVVVVQVREARKWHERRKHDG